MSRDALWTSFRFYRAQSYCATLITGRVIEVALLPERLKVLVTVCSGS